MSILLEDKRSNRGKRMSVLIGEAAELDVVFWNNSVWEVEEEADSFDEEDEEAEAAPDEFDSDFNDTETDEDEEDGSGQDSGGEGGKRRRKQMSRLPIKKKVCMYVC
jgi:hypothetical protein